MDRKPLGIDFVLDRQSFQGIKNVRYLHALRAPHRAGVAGSTDPDRSAGKDGFNISGSEQCDHFPRRDIHGVAHGTGARAAAALDALLDALPSRNVSNLEKKGIPKRFLFFVENLSLF